MKEKIKDFLYGLGGIGFIVLLIVGFSLLIIGGAKLFEWIYPILEKISIFTWGVVWLLVILSVVPRFRKFTGNGIVLGTYIGGAIFWLLCFYVTYSLWGLLGIFIGVLFFGLGVFVTAILALLFSGQFLQALFFVLNLATIYLLRALGMWIVTKYKPKKELTIEEDSSSEEYIAVPLKKLSKKPLSFGITFLAIFLFIIGIIEIYSFFKTPFPNIKIVWGVLSIVSGIGLLLQKFWAYRLTQAIFLINLIVSPLYLLLSEYVFTIRLIMTALGIILSGGILWYLSRKNIKEQFLEPIFTKETEKQKLSSKIYEREN
ncbi:hypothetical protein J7K44_01975 [bacterium]|nr:hypothetical protein [bacterium]